MALRDDRKFDGWNVAVATARPRESVMSVGGAEMTDERFIRCVALALRAQWEGGDVVDGASDREQAAEWSDYRAESTAAILAFLHELNHRGFRIVRKVS